MNDKLEEMRREMAALEKKEAIAKEQDRITRNKGVGTSFKDVIIGIILFLVFVVIPIIISLGGKL